MKTLPVGHAVWLSGSLELIWVFTKWLQICKVFITMKGSSNLYCHTPILFSFVIFITKTQLETYCPLLLSLLMRRRSMGGDAYLCRGLWLRRPVCNDQSFPAVHTWRVFLGFLQSSFLVHSGAKQWLALSSQGAFLPLFKMAPLLGLLAAWMACLLCSQTPHNWALTGEGFTRSHLPTSFGAARLLIITWEENRPGGENWRGGWRWSSQTLSRFSWTKRGPERGCFPCLGHELAVSV